MTDVFATASALSDLMEREKRFGNVYNGRYHMPLLPGEEGTKTDTGNWVPRGVTRVTRLAGAFVDTEALNIWEMEQALVGLALDVSLYEEACLLIRRALRDGVNFQKLKNHPDIRRAITGTWKDRDSSIVGRAKQTAGANVARQKGINRHDSWQERATSGDLFGSEEVRRQIEQLEELLAANHLRRVPGMQERVVRNVEVRAAGRFDDVLEDVRTGEWFMADLKTKATEFFTWLEVDIQLATYAHAEWMLANRPAGFMGVNDLLPTEAHYTHGPRHLVNQERGVVLHMPSNGDRPRLRKADLVRGWENARLARRIMDERSYGRSVARARLAEWSD